MRLGDEAVGVAEWLTATITQDAAMQAALGVPDAAGAQARVWDGIAPVATPYPFITFTIGDGQDWNPVGSGDRVMTAFSITVKGTDKGESYAPMSALAKRLYTLLTGNHNAAIAQGGTILTGRRTQAIQYPEQANGIEYRHIGGTFSIITQ